MSLLLTATFINSGLQLLCPLVQGWSACSSMACASSFPHQPSSPPKNCLTQSLDVVQIISCNLLPPLAITSGTPKPTPNSFRHSFSSTRSNTAGLGYPIWRQYSGEWGLGYNTWAAADGAFPSDPGIYRTSSQTLKLALCCSRSAERDRMGF